MALFSIPLDVCLKCDHRRVEAGDTVLLNLDPTKFSEALMLAFSPVPAMVLEVRLPEPPEPVSAAMTLELEVAAPDLPTGSLTLEPSDLESVTCQDCCMTLTARVVALEENNTVLSFGGNGAADSGKGLKFGVTGGAKCSGSFEIKNGTTIFEFVAYSGGGTEISGPGYTLIMPTGSASIGFPNDDGVVVLDNGAGITNPGNFRNVLGLGSAALLSEPSVLQTASAVSGFTGGGPTKLDGIATVLLALGIKRRIFVSGIEYIYELSAGTDLPASPSIIRPADYNGTTNARVWRLRPRYVVSDDVVDGSTGGNDIADTAKVVKYGMSGDLTASGSVRIYFGSAYGQFLSNYISVNRDHFLPNATGVLAITAQTDGSIKATDVTWSATNDSAAAGDIGQFVSSLVAAGAPVALTTATAANVTSISLTAGDWDVQGAINFAGAASTVTVRQGGINATTATVPTDGSQVHNGYVTTTTSEISSVTIPKKRISLAATTTIYLVASATFSAGTMAAFGQLNARRVR